MSEQPDAKIRLDERLYSNDGHPHWRNEPSAAEIEARARQCALRMRRGLRGVHPYLEVARTLEGCRPKNRCQNAACPRCTHAMQRRYVEKCIKEFEGQRVFQISLIPPDLRKPEGRLSEIDLRAARRDLIRLFRGSGLNSLLVHGAIDFSFNESSEGEWDPHWQLQWLLHGIGGEAEDIKAALDGVYQSTDSIPRPRHVREVTTDLSYAYSYALKSVFFRRVSYRRRDGQAGWPRKLALSAKAERELLSALHDWSVADRTVWIRPSSKHQFESVAMPRSTCTRRTRL